MKNDIYVCPIQLFDEIEQQRANGTINDGITTSPLKYQGCKAKKDYIEQIDSDGIVTVGTFKNGKFWPTTEL
jgi:hypothetical protein